MHKIIATATGLAMAFSAMPAFANGEGWHWWSSNDITVDNYNKASVSNTVVTSASTGGNSADGGNAYNSVSGGSVYYSDDDNTAGNGRNKAVGGDGGFIYTGNAIATSLVVNDVNNTTTKIKADCGCKGDITVTNKNKAYVTNAVITDADSGDNTADGGKAKNRVSGGSVEWSSDDNIAGNDGNKAHGGNGGEVWTGNADSLASVVNVVNTTVTRIRR